MGTSPLMSIGIKAMAANYAALQTTSHNIANANVAGYSRQQVRAGDGTRAVQRRRLLRQGRRRGRGDALARRVPDRAKRPARARWPAWTPAGWSSCSGWRASSGPARAGLGHASRRLPEFAWSTWPAAPPTAPRARWCWRAPATWPARYARGRQRARRVAGRRHRGTAGHAWPRSTAWRAASPRSTSASPRCAGSGQPANDLLDQRERLISELSQHVKTSRIEADDGSLAIFIGGGQTPGAGRRGGDS